MAIPVGINSRTKFPSNNNKFFIDLAFAISLPCASRLNTIVDGQVAMPDHQRATGRLTVSLDNDQEARTVWLGQPGD